MGMLKKKTTLKLMIKNKQLIKCEKTHILDGSIEAPHHHLNAVRHILGVSLKVRQDRGVDWRDVRRSPWQPAASVDGTWTVRWKI